MMNRRGFFKAVGAGFVAAAAVPFLPVPVVTQTVDCFGAALPVFGTITVDQMFGVDFEWTDIEAALALEGKRDDFKDAARAFCDAHESGQNIHRLVYLP